MNAHCLFRLLPFVLMKVIESINTENTLLDKIVSDDIRLSRDVLMLAYLKRYGRLPSNHWSEANHMNLLLSSAYKT